MTLTKTRAAGPFVAILAVQPGKEEYYGWREAPVFEPKQREAASTQKSKTAASTTATNR